MKKVNCVKCGKPLSKNSKSLCRDCYLGREDKSTGRLCTSCGKVLSNSASWSGGKFCRTCWKKSVTDNNLYWQNYEWLYDHYINKQMSTPQISKLVNAYVSRVGWWMTKLSIPMRTNGGTKSRKYTNKKNYVQIWSPNHPTASKTRPYKPEHVLIMEKHLGKILTPKDNVHHLNGIQNDNRVENLMYFPSSSEHKIFEGQVSLFAKYLLWGDIKPELSLELQNLFTQFLSRNG
jgi:hypothetical protein